MSDNTIVYDYLKDRGVTRLCHFTKVKNFVHIVNSEDGIIATGFINNDIKSVNDKNRYDNAKDYVCCSMQYPNGWYWEKAKKRDADTVFKEWIVLTIDLSIIKEEKIRYSPCNAAYENGNFIRDDIFNISEIFETSTVRIKYRPAEMLSCCPTDDQAEILVYKNIPLRFINGVIVGDDRTADHVGAILKTLGKRIPIFISPNVCNTGWSSMVRSGEIPEEIEYDY